MPYRHRPHEVSGANSGAIPRRSLRSLRFGLKNLEIGSCHSDYFQAVVDQHSDGLRIIDSPQITKRRDTLSASFTSPEAVNSG